MSSSAFGGDGAFHLLFRGRDFANQFAEDDVTHRKTDRGQRHGAVAELADQVVVTAAAGEGAEFPATVERFEDDAGIVGKAADDPEIDLNEVGEAAGAKRIDHPIQFFAAAFAVENLEGGLPPARLAWSAVFSRGSRSLLSMICKVSCHFSSGTFCAAEKINPELAVADADDHVVRTETEPAQKIDAERDRFDVRVQRSLADDVGVKLEMFAESAALLFLVAETLRDREPLERFFEFAIMRGHDPRQGRRELGPHRDFAFAFVGKIKKLPDDLRAAFFRVKLGRFQNRPFPFYKAVAACDLAAIWRRHNSAARNRSAGNHGNREEVALEVGTSRCGVRKD